MNDLLKDKLDEVTELKEEAVKNMMQLESNMINREAYEVIENDNKNFHLKVEE